MLCKFNGVLCPVLFKVVYIPLDCLAWRFITSVTLKVKYVVKKALAVSVHMVKNLIHVGCLVPLVPVLKVIDEIRHKFLIGKIGGDLQYGGVLRVAPTAYSKVDIYNINTLLLKPCDKIVKIICLDL